MIKTALKTLITIQALLLLSMGGSGLAYAEESTDSQVNASSHEDADNQEADNQEAETSEVSQETEVEQAIEELATEKGLEPLVYEDMPAYGVQELPSRLNQNVPSRSLDTPVIPTQPRFVFQEPRLDSPGLAEALSVPPEDSPLFGSIEPEIEEVASESEEEKKPSYIPLDVDETLALSLQMLDQKNNRYTLQMLYQEAIFDHPDLESALAIVLEKEGSLRISEAQRNAKMGIDIAVGPMYTDYVDNTPERLDWGSFSSYITQTIFDFGSVKLNIAADTMARETAIMRIQHSSDALVMLITQYYLNAIQAQEVVHLRRDEVLFYKNLRSIFLKKQEAGEGLMTDVQKLDISLKRAESNLINEMQRLLTFREMLSTLIYGKTIGWLEVDQNLFSTNMNASLDDLQSQAKTRNINVLALEREMQATQMKIDSMERNALPKIGYKITGGYQAEYPVNSFYAGAQATISWVFNDGGENKGQVAKLRSTLYKQRASYRSELIAITDRIKSAYNDYHTASKDLELAHNGKLLSIELTRNYMKEFDIGLRTLLDLVTAKEGEIEADMREVNSRFRCVSGLMRLYSEVNLLDNFLPVPEGIVEAMAKNLDINISHDYKAEPIKQTVEPAQPSTHPWRF